MTRRGGWRLWSALRNGAGIYGIVALLAFQGLPTWAQSRASGQVHSMPPAAAKTGNGETAPRSTHWAFTPPLLPKIPAVKHSAWVRTPVDAFVLAKLERAGIAPPPSTDRRTLLRRVYLDLIGLPPSLEEQQRFLAHTAPNAYEKVVDDLLSRKQYGERWGRHWLDTVRYAETNGYERDTPKRSAWRYRDWVIDSLNSDKPFRRFVQEQIAGDEVPDSNAESQTGASFLRLGTWDDEPPDHELDRYDQLDDILGTTASAFMGITLRCARCHDHKFEPFTQKDYYRLLSVFAPLQRPGGDEDRLVGTEAELKTYADAMQKADGAVAEEEKRAEAIRLPLRERLFTDKKTTLPADAVAAFRVAAEKRNDGQKDLVRKNTETINKEVHTVANPTELAKLDEIQRHIDGIQAARPKEPPRAYVWLEPGRDGPDICILGRGEPARRGERVTPGAPAVLVRQELLAPTPTTKTTGRRLWLADWLTRPDNPLVGRVFVNRVWQHHFGEGLVSTANDFGLMGRRPTHPELLDWLACKFMQEGSLKQLHRLIVLSNTYRATAVPGADAVQRDPENTLLSRWRVRRLEAETIRDSMLAVSGKINLAQGGPSIYPKLPQEVLQGQSRPGDGWGTTDERQSARRSVYIFVKRSLAVPEMEALDSPDTSSSCETRIVSTVAPQALTFLNGNFAREQANAFAARLLAEAGANPLAQMSRAFSLAYGRPPSPAELKTGGEFLTRQTRQIQTDMAKADTAVASKRALEAFCLILLNSNEFFYLN